eukprot:8092530-Pyramimonas_sp.AAC.1
MPEIKSIKHVTCRDHNMHKAGGQHTMACRPNMTLPGRTVRATRELNNILHTADVANFYD